MNKKDITSNHVIAVVIYGLIAGAVIGIMAARIFGQDDMGGMIGGAVSGLVLPVSIFLWDPEN
jgi:hypothetical protein